MGVPINVAIATISSEPKMALAKPPASLGGGVISVSSASPKPPTPKRTVSHKIHTSQNRPNAIAASDSASAMRLVRLRRVYIAWRAWVCTCTDIWVDVSVFMRGFLRSFSGD